MCVVFQPEEECVGLHQSGECVDLYTKHNIPLLTDICFKNVLTTFP